uniref:Uncharacterized protein n=1 Tax=Arundo donax TaxID=35708 RepID=A0A0A9PT37_ARUDO
MLALRTLVITFLHMLVPRTLVMTNTMNLMTLVATMILIGLDLVMRRTITVLWTTARLQRSLEINRTSI